MTLLLALLMVAAQADTLTLDHAYRSAAMHDPRAREAALATAVRDLRLENLDTRFLPSLSLGGQAVYHSDVAAIPLSLPGVSLPDVPRDQYRIGATVEQLVYDGGLTAASRAAERAAADVAVQEVAVDAYGIREQVETAWFGALLAGAEAAQLDLLASDLDARLGQVEARVARGAATASDADVLRAERIRVTRQRDAAASRRRVALDVLGELTGWSLPDEVHLPLPRVEPSGTGDRPELALFEHTRQSLKARGDLAVRATRPRLTSFVDAAVGRPQGLDLFENEVGPFVSFGVRLGWPLWDWNRASRERQALRLQAEAVTAREEAFLQRIRIAEVRVVREIARLERDLAADTEVIALRSRVTEEARSRLDNGVITASDYLVERNAEHLARLAEDVHRIQLAQARARLVTIRGAS